MFDQFVNWILSTIEHYGLWGVFVGSILEEAIAPIPSPAVMMGAGAVLLRGYSGISAGLGWEMTQIAFVGAFGALLGSYLMYGIGYFGGKLAIEKTSRFTGVKWETIEKFEKKFNSGTADELTITGLRAIPVMPSVVIALTCGVLRIKPLSYSISFFFGGVIRNFVYLIIGWQLGEAYLNGANGLENVSDIVLKVIVVAAIVGIGYLYWKREKAEKSESN